MYACISTIKSVVNMAISSVLRNGLLLLLLLSGSLLTKHKYIYMYVCTVHQYDDGFMCMHALNLVSSRCIFIPNTYAEIALKPMWFLLCSFLSLTLFLHLLFCSLLSFSYSLFLYSFIMLWFYFLYFDSLRFSLFIDFALRSMCVCDCVPVTLFAKGLGGSSPATKECLMLPISL